MECCLRHIGRWQAGRGVDGTTASARGVPRSAPRSNPRLGGSNTCLAPYFNILTFSDAVCCSSQLASSSVAHPGPNAAGNALLVTDGDVDTRFVHSILFWYTLFVFLGTYFSRVAARWPTLAGLVPICPRGHFSRFDPKVPHFSNKDPRVTRSVSSRDFFFFVPT